MLKSVPSWGRGGGGLADEPPLSLPLKNARGQSPILHCSMLFMITKCKMHMDRTWHEVLRLLLTSSGQEWQFHMSTDIWWSRMAISYFYWHLVVQNGNLTFLLSSSGQEWQFHMSTDILWPRMAILYCYRHVVVKNGNFIWLVTSHGQEWQFHMSTDI